MAQEPGSIVHNGASRSPRTPAFLHGEAPRGSGGAGSWLIATGRRAASRLLPIPWGSVGSGPAGP